MIRFISTALVILGLILQPFAVARSASLAGRGMGDTVSKTANAMDEYHHDMNMTDEAAAMACNEKVSASTNIMDCDDCCEMDCPMVEHCVTTCSVIPFVAIQSESTYFEGNNQMSLASNAIAHSLGQSSFIYHPPKHS